MIYRAVLEADGYEVHTADNGLTALSLVRLQRYVVVVSDINMPSMNGLIFLSLLKEELPLVPVILITGIAMTAEADTAQRFGAFAVLAKPFPLPELNEAVVAAITHSKTMQM